MGDRCTGHCCHGFTLPMSPEQLQMSLENARFVNKHTDNHPDPPWGLVPPQEEWPHPDEAIVTEIVRIAPAMTYLGLETHDRKTGEPHPRPIHRYSCKHKQEDGNCGIYEERFHFCRSYPDGQPCMFDGCTWDAAREGRVDRRGRVRLPQVDDASIDANDYLIARSE